MARVSSRSLLSGDASIRRSAASALPLSFASSVHHLVLQQSGLQSPDASGDSNDNGDDDDAVLTNLTLDGVQEGPYMLCKHADDLLGHHARQVFREKAASMRGDNSIYYYLKELMKTFGNSSSVGNARSQAAKKPSKPEPLVLEAHGFRKLIASDPAFQCAISSGQVDALFHRIKQEHESVIRHQDFVEFCLLDHNQLCVRLGSSCLCVW